MTTSLEVLFTPADFAALEGRDLSETVCVVFDVLRATSSIVTALANGASAIFPVAGIYPGQNCRASHCHDDNEWHSGVARLHPCLGHFHRLVSKSAGDRRTLTAGVASSFGPGLQRPFRSGRP